MRDPKGPVKAYKSPEEIAKQHKVPLDKVLQQVKVGTKVEGEHTTSKSGARITALQHVDELPDYYTRLKKVEKIKESEETTTPPHRTRKPSQIKKTIKLKYLLTKMEKAPKTTKESLEVAKMGLEGKRYCRLCRKSETQQECKFGPEMWNKFSIATVHPANMPEGNLHQWFSGSKDKSGKPGWVNVVTGDSCASDKPGEGVPKCVSSSKRASMTPAERRSAAARKRAADPGQQEKSGAAKPTYVPTDKMKEEFVSEEDKKGKGSGKKDACYHKVKARFKVWPSAYASGALVKCRQAGAKNWGNKSEGYFYEDHKEIASGKMKDEEGYMANIEMDKMVKSIEILRKIIKKPDMQLPAWVQSKITRAADFIDTAADYLSSDEEVSEACWTGYKQVGMKKKGKKVVPNCVPAEDTCMTFSKFMHIAEARKKIKISTNKPIEFKIADIGPGKKEYNIKTSKGWKDIKEVAAWQRKEGKNREGGLNEKGRKSYERENPGSDLKAPSKTVGNPRRASFCARMSGMKRKLTSKKTANDPNSRINKSLRAWNC
jgi:hypothetical protein